MKKTIVSSLLAICLIITTVSCSKSNSSTPSTTAFNASWQTTVFGGPNDTLNMSINAGVGIITYVNPGVLSTTIFKVNDTLFSNIAGSANSATAIGTYYYNDGTTPKFGHANATLTLQSPTVLFVHYTTDINTGITPPDYYYYKL